MFRQWNTERKVEAEHCFKLNLIQRSEHNAMHISVSCVYPRNVSGNESGKIFIVEECLK